MNNIFVGEEGDILARYRIPKTSVEKELQLPTESDSSAFSDDEENIAIEEASKEENEKQDK